MTDALELDTDVAGFLGLSQVLEGVGTSACMSLPPEQHYGGN